MDDEMNFDEVIAAAEQAASIGDYEAAERHLVEALRIQESRLGPTHPDLADTLNNLGVLYERSNHLDEAERSYRRAYDIACEAWPADHPSVTTTAANLREFCRLNGREFDAPEPALDEPAPMAEVAPAPVASAPELPPRSRHPLLLLLVVALVVVVVLIGLVVARQVSQGTSSPTEVAEPALPANPVTEAEAPPVPAPDASIVDDTASDDVVVEPEPATAAPAEPVAEAPPVDEPVDEVGATPEVSEPASTVEVELAEVCQTLATDNVAGWQCDPVAGAAAPGVLSFYTRLRTPRDTTVEHRWYRGDVLHQSVALGVSANLGPGYRTYSRNTVTADGAGDWRAELRDADGVVLAEVRFSVRPGVP